MEQEGKEQKKDEYVKRILITGANSYIGTSFEAWMKQHEGYDSVFHVAGIAHQNKKKVSKDIYYKVNAELAEETAKRAKAFGVKQFIYMGSMSIYGESGGIGEKRVIRHSTEASPVDDYGKSKWEGEKRVRALSDSMFQVAVLRPPMIYGAGCKGNYRTLEKLAGSGIGGIYFPQDKQYSNTSEMVRQIALENRKRIWISKIWNPLVYLAALLPSGRARGMVKKAFGNMVYEREADEM